MTETEIRQRPGGRSARVRNAVLEATRQVLVDGGIREFAVKEVARRADVNETSIYRRWGTRENLICDALLNYSEQQIPVPDTGSVREDLATFAASLASYLSSPLGSALTHALAVADDDPAITQARAEFWRARYQVASQIIERAIARGELPETTSAELVLQALAAPMHFRLMLTRQSIDESLPRRLANLVLDGIRAGC